jgi:lipid-binding SYLF domain-containing protein
MQTKSYVLLLGAAVVLAAATGDETAERLKRASTVLNTLTHADHGIRPGTIGGADCVAVIPGFKKAAAVVGVGYGRGFISCRNGSNWSAPGAIKLEAESLGVQVGGEDIDIVIVSTDKDRRSKLLSDRFAIGSDASAAWGNGKSAHDDSNAKILFYGQTKGVFAGFGLDGATLKPDESADSALYGGKVSNNEIVEGGTQTPAVAQQFIATLAQASNR